MNTPSTIIKSIILPLVVKISKGNVTTLPDDYWAQFAIDFIHFENNATPIYTALYQLELQNPEAVFEKLPQAYSSFIKELAEEYVLGNQSEMTAELLENKNETFLKEVSFLTVMKSVIAKVERQELKKNLPQLYDRLVFELDEEILRQVAKKKSREDLRAKFQQWDEEMVESEPILMETNYSAVVEEPIAYKIKRIESKIVSLSWIKYAAAACVLIAAGLFYFKSSESNIVPEQNSVVTAPEKEEDKKDILKPKFTPPVKVAASRTNIVFTSRRAISVIGPTTLLGYTSNETNEKILMYFKDVPFLILQFEKDIKIATDKKSETHNNLEFYKRELTNLKAEKGKYEFEKGRLFLYEKDTNDYTVLLTEEKHYYLKKGDTFYYLKNTETPLPLKKVSDYKIIEALDKISFENE